MRTMTQEVDSLLKSVHENSKALLTLASNTTTRAADVEAAMSKLLSVVHRAAAEVAENWNKRNSGMWGKLPAELRSECWRHLDAEDKYALTNTSRKWRDDALAMPELWTTIQYPSMGCRNVAELRAVLARSGHTSRALSVTLKSSICDDDGILDELSKHAHRIKSFGTTQCWPISVTPQGFVPFFALLRPERLRLDGMGCLEVVNALSSNSTGLFSELISLVVPGTPFPTECQPIPTLLELDCLFSANTDGRRIFELFPNIERLSIAARKFRTSDRLPQGPPPTSLNHVVLTELWSIPDMSSFLRPWAGRRHLETIRMNGVEECASLAELFTSICVGPWTLGIPTDEEEPWLTVMFVANGAERPWFQAGVSRHAHPRAVLDCVPYFGKLDTLVVPPFILIALAEAGYVTLPAVRDISILQSCFRDRHEDEAAPCLRLLEMVNEPRSVLRSPGLRTIAFGFGGGCAPQLLSFAVALRSIISFSSERLERITFYEVDEDDAARIDREGGIRQKLCQLAHEIHWKERNYRSDVVDGDDGSSSYEDEGFDEEDSDDDI